MDAVAEEEEAGVVEAAEVDLTLVLVITVATLQEVDHPLETTTTTVEVDQLPQVVVAVSQTVVANPPLIPEEAINHQVETISTPLLKITALGKIRNCQDSIF